MKSLIFLSLFFGFSSLALSAPTFSLSSNWKKVDQKKDIAIFRDAKETKKLLTVAWLELGEDIPMNQDNFKSEVEKMQTKRSRVNKLMGLEDWMIAKSDFKTDAGKRTLFLEGAYKKDGEEYRFWERQIYIGKKYYQVKIEAPTAQAPSSDELVKTFNAVGAIE